VGTFAVQIARSLGAEVTAVCSRGNVDLVRSIGAHHVIDYTAEDFATGGRQYDVVVQVAGNRSMQDLKRALARRGTLVIVGGGTGRDASASYAGMLDMLGILTGGRIFSRPLGQRVRLFMAKSRTSDLRFLSELIEAGKLLPVIDRAYALPDAADAIRYLEAGHARGKVVVIPSV
jgi:NADPH:quinone reductase-like Zn-dependent oxidoreductase